MANYAAITKPAGAQEIQGGYKDVFFFAPLSSFLALQKPTASPTVLGDKVKITTAHTFTSPAGFLSWACKKRSVTIAAETTGDPGAQQIRYTATFVVLGDGPEIQEQMDMLLNDDIICLLKESNCIVNDSYVQLGDECVTPDITVAFNSNNNAEGSKEWTVTIAVTGKKFFYTGAVTEAS